MSPLANGAPTAAELDRAIKGQEAYDVAVRAGKTPDQALEIAKETMREHHRRQVLRSVG